MSCQRTDREQQPTGNSDYRQGRTAHIPKIDDVDRRVADDLQDVRRRDHAKFDSVETLTSASQSVDIMTARRYLARIRSFFTVAFGKPECLSASVCAPPSYILLSDVLEIITNTRSLDSLAASDSDDTFYTVDEYTTHVSNLPPLASEAFREELHVRGYLERPDRENRFLRWLRCTFVPWLQALHNRWSKQVTSVPISSGYPQRTPTKIPGRRGGLTVWGMLKPVDIEEDPCVPTQTRPPLSDQSVYWSCKSPPMTPDPSASPSVQEGPLSACLSCDSRVFSYATSYTTLPSPRDLADLGRGDVPGTIGSISEATLRSLAPRVAMMDVKHSCVGLDARSYPRLWYAEVCHHCLA